MYNILIPDRLSPPADIEKNIFGSKSSIKLTQAKNNDEVSNDTWAWADAVLAWHDLDFNKDLLDKLTNCKVIVRVGVGIDNVDIEAAGKKGIVVSNVPDYGIDDVADHAMAFILNFARGLIISDISVRSGEWNWNCATQLKRLKGSTIGIIGLGRIGTAVAIRAKSFGLKVAFYDPYVSRGIEKSLDITRYENILDIAEISDIISVHVPLTSETHKMIGSVFFKSCKKTPILVNTARGKVIDPDALYKALKTDVISSAGLDVLYNEPPDFTDSLMKSWKDNTEWLRGRLIITPHSAFCNQQSLKEMREKAAAEAKRILTGNEPFYCVNKQYL